MDRVGESTDLSPLWPPRFDGAIFDFDGTLASTFDIWTQVDGLFLAERGIELTTEYQRILTSLGFTAGARYTIDTYGLSESVQEVCEEWTRLSRALYETEVRLRPGAEAYIAALRSRGKRCALATINEGEVLHACRHVDPTALFDAEVYASDVSRPKDHPGIYLEAARRIGVPPERCMVFEDSIVGLGSAKRAGFITCAVASGEPTQRLPEVRLAADVFLSSWEDIPL